MVFATEINSVYLIWGFMIMPLLLTVFEAIFKAITGRLLPVSDGGLGIVIYAVLLFYITLATRRFYKFPLWPSIGIALLFYIAHYIIVQIIYKFLLFTIAINLLH